MSVEGVVTLLPNSPAPNTHFDVLEGVTITVNEQIVTHMQGALAQVVVNAFHVTLAEGNVTGIVGDVWIAQSICRAAGPDVLLAAEPVGVPPTFTG